MGQTFKVRGCNFRLGLSSDFFELTRACLLKTQLQPLPALFSSHVDWDSDSDDGENDVFASSKVYHTDGIKRKCILDCWFSQ